MVQLSSARDRDYAGVRAVSALIAVHQDITVERLDRKMNAPTMSVSLVAVTGRDKARETSEEILELCIRGMLRLIQQATHALEAESAESDGGAAQG